MRQSQRQYIVSEQFIHDDLAKDCEIMVGQIFNMWKKHKKINPMLVLWPAHSIATDDGGVINDIVVADLPLETTARDTNLLRDAVDKVSAYAFFFVRREENAIKALLESPHGTRSWLIPISRSADVYVLGRPVIQNNKDYLGLLWVPHQGSS